ncbi:MAG: hypothetical protein E5W63_05010, partial [Mesorhizobium sp.]
MRMILSGNRPPISGVMRECRPCYVRITDERREAAPMSSTWMTTRAWLLMLPLLVVMVAVIG